MRLEQPQSRPADEKSKVMAALLARLGPETEAAALAEHAKREGLDIRVEEAAALREALLARAATPPGPDQPSPQEGAPGAGADRVAAVMSRAVDTVAPHCTLQDAAARM